MNNNKKRKNYEYYLNKFKDNHSLIQEKLNELIVVGEGKKSFNLGHNDSKISLIDSIILDIVFVLPPDEWEYSSPKKIHRDVYWIQLEILEKDKLTKKTIYCLNDYYEDSKHLCSNLVSYNELTSFCNKKFESLKENFKNFLTELFLN